MPEPNETKEQPNEVSQPSMTAEEQLFSDMSMDEMLEKHSTVIFDASTKGTEQPAPEKPVEEEKKPEEKKETAATETKPEDDFDQLFTKYPKLNEYKNAFDNREKWNTSLTQKGQHISWFDKLTPEEQEAVINNNLPIIYGKKELPKLPADLINEYVGKLEIPDLKYVDKDEFEVNVPADKILPIVKEKLKTALEKIAPELALLRKQADEYKEQIAKMNENLSSTQFKLGNTEANSLVSKHKMLEISRINDDEGILDAIVRVMKVGIDHPEYDKALKWKAIFNTSDENKWTLDKSFNKLYGSIDKESTEKEMAEKVAKENQKGKSQETPTGITPKAVEDWEGAMGDIGSRADKIDKLFKS